MIFLEENKIHIKNKLNLSQTGLLILLFSQDLKHIYIDNMMVPGDLECKCRMISVEEISVLFDFLVEVNSNTFRDKKFFAPSNWRLSSMKYMDLVHKLFSLFNRNRGYENYRKLFTSKLNEGSNKFSLLEKREDTSSIWKTVLTYYSYYGRSYGTMYVRTRNPFKMIFTRHKLAMKSVI
jgi:hypothetical protein